MDIDRVDEQLRGVYETNAPMVNEAAFRTRLRSRVGKRRNRVLATVCVRHRPVLLAATAVVVVGLVVVGVLEVTKLLGPGEPTLAISGEAMSPGGREPAATEAIYSIATDGITGAKAELLGEIEHVREGLEAGTLVLGWPTPGIAAGQFPSDPVELLNSLEASLLAPDVALYLSDGADAAGLKNELMALPEVVKVVIVSKEEALRGLRETFTNGAEIFDGLTKNPLPDCLEVWLKHPETSQSFAEDFKARAEIDQAVCSHIDYAEWTERLRSLAHSPGDMQTSTTWGEALLNETTSTAPPTNGASSSTVPPTTSTTSGERSSGQQLSWGEVCRLGGREVTVERPVIKPEYTGTRPGSMLVYSLVTIRNTGTETLECSGAEFLLEGRSSGSTGIRTLDGTIDGLPILFQAKLSPGESLAAAICCSLSQGDTPVKVRLGTRSGNRISSEPVLAVWQ